MITQTTIIIANKKGIHARPAAAIVKQSQLYAAEITIACRGKKADAKNMMSVLMLAAGFEDSLTITANGEDSDEAVSALAGLFATNFQEIDST